jgi:hypothetical protein
MSGNPTPKIKLDPSKLLGLDHAAATAAKVGRKPSSAPLVTLPDLSVAILSVTGD